MHIYYIHTYVSRNICVLHRNVCRHGRHVSPAIRGRRAIYTCMHVSRNICVLHRNVCRHGRHVSPAIRGRRAMQVSMSSKVCTQYSFFLIPLCSSKGLSISTEFPYMFVHICVCIYTHILIQASHVLHKCSCSRLHEYLVTYIHYMYLRDHYLRVHVCMNIDLHTHIYITGIRMRSICMSTCMYRNQILTYNTVYIHVYMCTHTHAHKETVKNTDKSKTTFTNDVPVHIPPPLFACIYVMPHFHIYTKIHQWHM
jgi:hypothetical protein